MSTRLEFTSLPNWGLCVWYCGSGFRVQGYRFGGLLENVVYTKAFGVLDLGSDLRCLFRVKFTRLHKLYLVDHTSDFLKWMLLRLAVRVDFLKQHILCLPSTYIGTTSRPQPTGTLRVRIPSCPMSWACLRSSVSSFLAGGGLDQPSKPKPKVLVAALISPLAMTLHSFATIHRKTPENLKCKRPRFFHAPFV